MDNEPHIIIAVRQQHGWSQEDLAAQLGVGAMTVSRWERGESLPHRRRWAKLEEIVGRPIAEILADCQRPPVREAAQ
jgi:transcriptional regulator with XRE-family HTH domain